MIEKLKEFTVPFSLAPSYQLSEKLTIEPGVGIDLSWNNSEKQNGFEIIKDFAFSGPVSLKAIYNFSSKWGSVLEIKYKLIPENFANESSLVKKFKSDDFSVSVCMKFKL
ncbi:MAG: hypothetical protein ABI543_14205 [Ignavibacteria bacterium]